MFMFILANPDVAFNYYTDNDVVYSSPGEGLKSAIDSVFLPKIADKMLKIEPYTGAENIRVSGYTGSYEIFKNNKTQQIVVLNGRIVTDSVLTATVQNAYGERLMNRCFPIYVLEIVMPFADVDVNVHPNKKEVRFAKPRAVYGAVYRAVADTLEKFDTERRGQLTESFTLNLSENAEKKTENPPRGESDAGEGSVSGGKKVSKISLQEALAKNGIELKHATLSRYIEVLLQSKILYQCDRFDMKSKRALSGEKKYYLADISFYFATNTDNRINYGPALENMVYVYAKSLDYSVSVGRIGKLECDFILRDNKLDYCYVQVAYTIGESKSTEDREYAPLESIADNYPKYVLTTDYLLQNRNGIKHVNLLEFMKNRLSF